ncbi:MAG TPA: SusF/SusE family outer membrane protein, partial [Saprospiraceae bacterium]|nr:SusF/SusE family outer membrane protein [Saprospiraceae bacterium]
MKLRLLFSLFLTLMLFSVKAQIDTVGLIGSATPDGWNSDQTMVQDPDSSNLFTLDIHLTAGEAKFRANHDWAVNWGSTSFPTGIGTQDGPNIPILAGQYHVSFNSTTGAYNFAVVSDIGIIGSATPDGWNSDQNMYRDEADSNAYYLRIDLVSGEAKFRQNDDWAVNWGAADFPSGIGVQNGPNIPIAQAGTYDVSFNKSTGAYNFIPFFTISTVGIVGTGTPGGNTETPMFQNGNIWTLSTHLSTGGLQFTINNGDAFWGGPDFPIGIATNGGGEIPVTEGNWQIELNTTTGAYTFYPIQIFDSVGLIGSATPGGWDTDSDMQRSSSDSSLWSLRIVLVDGEAKFRANHDWAVNWGAGDFPSGIGLRDGANIPVPAGEYIVTFNSITGAYNFKLLVLYDRVGL